MKRRDRPGKKTATIDFDINLYDRIKQLADSQERDFASQVRFIVKEWFEAQDNLEASKGKQ